MNEFVIVSDSTVDLPKEYLQSKQVPIISLSYIMDGVTYEEMDGLSHKEFFEKLRAGSLPTTSQINPEQAREALELFAKEGKDILIGFNPCFLMDALSVIDVDEITMYMINPKAPCFIRDQEETYIYLILPVNFNV